MTSSGRRVKRKNLDGCDDSLIRNNRTRKSRNGRKASSKKSSSKSRPRRAAARNALHLFSRITGASTDGDINGSDGDSSESRSTLQDSSFGSEESDASLQKEWYENLKGKEISLDHTVGVDQPHSYHESHSNGASRKKLILKLPNRDSSKFVSHQNTVSKCDESQSAVAGSSSRIPQKVNETNIYLEEECHVGVDGDNKERSNIGQPDMVERHLDLLGGCKDGAITWGGVRTRTSKRLKMGEPSSTGLFARSGSVLDQHIEAENVANDHSTFLGEHETELPSTGIQNQEGSLEEIVYKKESSCRTSMPGSLERAKNVEGYLVREGKDADASSGQCHVVCNGTTMPSVPCANGTENQFKLKENYAQIPTKLRIKSGTLSRNNDNPGRTLFACPAEDKVKFVATCENPDTEKNLDLPVPVCDSIGMPCSDNKDHYGVPESEGLVNGASSRSELEDSLKLDSNKRMFTAVYRRLKPSRCRSNPEGDSGSMEASTSNVGKHNLGEEIEIPPEGIRRARSIRLRSTARDLNLSVSNFKFKEPHDNSEDTSIDVSKASPSRGEDNSSGEWKSLSRNSIRLRSTRTKRSSNYTRDSSPPRKSNQIGKSSWLMLSAHEEGSRYIPQQGDDVVYLRQVDA